MVMDMLGPSLEDLFMQCKRKFDLKSCCLISQQMIKRIEKVHEERIIHRDIKPDNFALKDKKIYLIDYGWATENIPGYPYFNLNLKMINDSKSFNELFHNIYNKSSSLLLQCGVSLNYDINKYYRITR